MMNIKISHVSKIIKNNPVIKDISMELQSGAVYGFKGINGSGKTMLMRLISGLIRPSQGEISMNGKILGKDISFPNSIGVFLENPAFLDAYSGFNNLKLLASIKSVASDDDIRNTLLRVGLDPDSNKKYKKYSLGMKQRLGIAAAIMEKPEIVILDEPTNGLDPAGIQEMRELIRDLPSRFGMTVVVSSHLLSEIDQMADTVGIIREGVLVFQDTLAALHGRSRHHLALRTTNNALAAQVLREKGIGWTEEGDYLVLPILPDEQAAGLCRALVEGRLGLVRLEERQKSLEDIFLELTGKAASL